jgi:hypothetical protein
VSEGLSYTGNSELVDSVALETSMLSPREHSHLLNVARHLTQTFVDRYQSYIPDATVQEVQGIENRFVVMDVDSFQTFYGVWSGNDTLHPKDGALSFYFKQGRIMSFVDPEEAWDYVLSDSAKRRLIQMYGSEERAMYVSSVAILYDNLAHEIVHQFQDHNLPRAFLECSARYYQREVVSSMGLHYPVSEATEARIEFYKRLTEEHDGIHGICFGSASDVSMKQNILARFTTQEITRLFPRGC